MVATQERTLAKEAFDIIDGALGLWGIANARQHTADEIGSACCAALIKHLAIIVGRHPTISMEPNALADAIAEFLDKHTAEHRK